MSFKSYIKKASYREWTKHLRKNFKRNVNKKTRRLLKVDKNNY